MANGRWLIADVNRHEPGHWQAGVPKAPAHHLFIARGGRRFRRMPRQAERLRDAGGDHRRPVADDEDAVDLLRSRALDNRGNGSVFIEEADRNGSIAPWVVDLVAPVGCE